MTENRNGEMKALLKQVLNTQEKINDMLNSLNTSVKLLSKTVDRMDARLSDGLAREINTTLQEGFKDVITLINGLIQDMKTSTALEQERYTTSQHNIEKLVKEMSNTLNGYNKATNGLKNDIKNISERMRQLDISVTKTTVKWVGLVGLVAGAIAALATAITTALQTLVH